MVGWGEKKILFSDAVSESQLGREKKKKKCEDNRWEKSKKKQLLWGGGVPIFRNHESVDPTRTPNLAYTLIPAPIQAQARPERGFAAFFFQQSEKIKMCGPQQQTIDMYIGLMLSSGMFCVVKWHGKKGYCSDEDPLLHPVSDCALLCCALR